MMRTLDQLEIGEEATVEAIRPDAPSAGVLSAMGLLPGRKVRVERCAPLGDPITLSFDGQVVSVRKHDAAYVTVS